MSKYLKKNTGKYTERFSNANRRPNKTASGITKTFERAEKYGKSKHSELAARLSLFGTLDILAKTSILSFSKKVLREHPTDRGYFKEVYILSDFGKRRLRLCRGKD